ncbi:hypothetical protein ACQY0O_007853 [Thecaphora frezii]
MLLRPVFAVALLALATASIAAPLPVKPPFSIEQPSTWDHIEEILSYLNGPSSPPHGNDISGNPVHQSDYQGWQQPVDPINPVHYPYVHQPNPDFHNFHATQASQEPSTLGWDQYVQNNMLHQGNAGQAASSTNVHNPLLDYPGSYGGGSTGGYQPNPDVHNFHATQASQEPSTLGWDQYVQNNMLHQGNAGQAASSTNVHNPLLDYPGSYGGGATGGRQAAQDSLDPFYNVQRTSIHPSLDDWWFNALLEHAKPSGSKLVAVENTASHPFPHQPEVGPSRTDGGSSANLQQGSNRHQPPVLAAEPQEPAKQAHHVPSPRQAEPQSQKATETNMAASDKLRKTTLNALKNLMYKSLQAYQNRKAYIDQVRWSKDFDPQKDGSKNAKAMWKKKAQLSTLELTENWTLLRYSSKHAFNVAGYRIAVQRVQTVKPGWRKYRLLALNPKQGTHVYMGIVDVPEELALVPPSLTSKQRNDLGIVSSQQRASASGDASSKPMRNVKQRRS